MKIPYLKKVNGKSILMVHEKPFIMLSGEVHNSSSSTTEYMQPIWEKLKQLNLNSVLLPISWELIEPKEGVFCFDLVDGLLRQAREFQMKIGFLWFGSWKNAQCSYAPEWVKEDRERFKRTQVEKGQKFSYLKGFHGMPYTSLSAFCEETMIADAKAFSKLMEHLYNVDSEENTVIMVQVENEAGILGTAREHSDLADTLFAQNVPQYLVAYMEEHSDTLEKDILTNMQNGKKQGSWAEVFGTAAEELFTAFYTAKFVGHIAKAGKAVYPLPMAVNAWLVQGGQPGQYPSGGPVARVMEIWKYAAPEIDIFAPDIYVPSFCEVCEEYTKLENPLFIPEIAGHGYAGIREIYAIGRHHAIGYSPFGIEDLGITAGFDMGEIMGIDVTDPLLKLPQNIEIYAKINEVLTHLTPLLTSKYGTNDLQAVIKEQKDDFLLSFGEYGFNVIFQSPFLKSKEGVCLALKLSENEFLFFASGCMLKPVSLQPESPYVDLLSVEEGCYQNGQWHMIRKWNGDQTSLMLIDKPLLLKMKVCCFL